MKHKQLPLIEDSLESLEEIGLGVTFRNSDSDSNYIK